MRERRDKIFYKAFKITLAIWIGIFATLFVSSKAFSITLINNNATAEYTVGGLTKTTLSNLVKSKVCERADLELLRYAPTSIKAKKHIFRKTLYITANGTEVELSNPKDFISNNEIPSGIEVPLSIADIFHAGEPVFLKVIDGDHNIDNTKIDEIMISILVYNEKKGEIYDEEKLKIFETDVDTGVFLGFIESSRKSAIKNDGLLSVKENFKIILSYADNCGPDDTSTNVKIIKSSSLVDPFGIIFDSSNGKPLNGVKITLLNASTNLPATVYGDDGVSTFPSTVITGSTVTDSSGVVYVFSEGEYRFPLIPAGDYILKVEPPNGYKWPSLVSDENLNKLNNGAFIITIGSRGETFNVPHDSLPIKIDIPLDPVNLTAIYLTKEAAKETISLGEFLRYKLTLENISLYNINNVVVKDNLPLGFKYKSGSTKVNGTQIQDPIISADGRTLEFFLGNLATNSKIVITYVVEIAAGAKFGKSQNVAFAIGDGGMNSNTAKAEVLVKDDLFQTKSFIIGKVAIGCKNVEQDTKPEIKIEKEIEYIKKEEKGSLSAQLFSSISEKDSIYNFINRINLRNSDLGVSNVRVIIKVPDGMRYQSGSSSFGDKPIEPQIIQGDELTYKLGDLPAGFNGDLTFLTMLSKTQKDTEFTTKALVIFDTENEKDLIIDGLDTVYKLTRKSEATTVPPIVIRPNFSSGSAILTEEDKLRLDDLISRLKDYKIKSIEVIGHTDNQKIGQRLKSTYPDNYALSKARAESVISYLMRFLDLSSATLRTVGKGEDEPVVPNTNEYNMSINRRVEINIIAEKVTNFYQVLPIKEKNEDKYLQFIKTETVKEEVTKPEKKTSQTEKKEQSNKREIKSISDLTQEWIERERPGFEFVLPKDGYYPPLPYLDIAIKYDPSSKLRLFINGKEVEDIFVDSTRKNSMLLTGLKIWSGVNLTEGDNVLEAVEYDAKGKESRRIKKIVHYSGPPVTLKHVPEKSRLIADGKNPPVIAVKLLDKDGHPARENVVGEYTILPPYMPFNVLKDLQADPLTKSTKAYSNYIVKEEGITYIELAPTSQTGEVKIKFKLISGEKELKVWLKPEKRDWILVGLAEGTLGMNSSSGNKNNFSLSDIKDGWSTDGRLAFFAKGMLDDNWLLTLSYDSDRTGYRGNNRLFSTIDPSKYYTLYGDSTNQQYEAQSSKPLYVKLERDRFYALFGDFQSGLESTELSKYTRSLTGLKSELRGNILDFNLFIADTNQLFMREELRGDGTSGLYKLSGKNIVINSEKITIEVRDRFKSEVKISSKTLTRFIDYNIDYDTGTIFFKSPVSPYDENFNPQYILVEYELFDMSKTVLNYGGRGAIKLWDRKLEIGASYIHEEAIGKDGNLLGIDVKVNISEKTQFKAEIAETDVNNGGQNITGKAYLAELTHKSDKLRGKIYFRELEKDFGLGQQNISELGTRKMGLTTNYYLTQNLDLGTDILRQYNLTDNNRRDLAEIITTYNSKKYELKLGLRHAEDTLANGDRLYSDQLMAGGAVRLLDEKLTLKVHREQSVVGNKNVDFPTRTKFGADYRLNQKVVFFAEHEILDGKNVETELSRIGMKSNLWQGGQLNSTIEQQHSENGTRIFSVMGLQQTWQLNEKWSLTGGLDRSDTIKKATYTVNGNTFSAGAEGDFTAVNLGVGYKEKFWGANSRIEYRDGKEQDKAGIYTSIYSEVKEGLGIGSSLQIFDTKTHSSEQIFADLKFGLVYRPKISRWTILDKLDIIFDSLRSIEDRYKSLRFINVVNLNYKDSKKLQFSIQYGAKYVTESIDDKDYKGYTDVIGIEGRYDIKNNWDIGLRVKLLHSWNANQYKYLFGPMIGYTPKKNIWVSLGYNLSGFVDRDFSKSDYTAHGIFFNFRLKFDEESTKNAIRWFLTSPIN